MEGALPLLRFPAATLRTPAPPYKRFFKIIYLKFYFAAPPSQPAPRPHHPLLLCCLAKLGRKKQPPFLVKVPSLLLCCRRAQEALPPPLPACPASQQPASCEAKAGKLPTAHRRACFAGAVGQPQLRRGGGLGKCRWGRVGVVTLCFSLRIRLAG